MSSRDYRTRQALPPIRDVLGDQLGRRPHQDGLYQVQEMQRSLPSITSQSHSKTAAPTLTHSSQKYETTLAHGGRHTHESPGSYVYHSARGRDTNRSQPPPAAPYSYDVFRPSSTGLVHALSSERSPGILRTTRVDAGRRQLGPEAHQTYDEEDEREKKYPCPKCGKRFDRPSSLKTHQAVHSDEKTHECPHPGCGKTFTVLSNMRRHYRKTHEGGGPGEDADDDHYSYYHGAQGPSTNYYSSRR